MIGLGIGSFLCHSSPFWRGTCQRVELWQADPRSPGARFGFVISAAPQGWESPGPVVYEVHLSLDISSSIFIMDKPSGLEERHFGLIISNSSILQSQNSAHHVGDCNQLPSNSTNEDGSGKPDQKERKRLHDRMNQRLSRK